MTGSKSRTIIQERDRALLRELAVMRVIDREQAKLLAGFRSTTRANARLLALYRAGLLRRFFLGTVGGARKALYALSQNGATFVGVPYRGPRRRQDEALSVDFFVSHQLAVSEVLIAAKCGLKSSNNAEFIRWAAFHESLAKNLSLVPDGYVEVRTQAKTIAAFLEADLGHETHSVWRRKVEGYVRYALGNDFAERFGHPQFRVLAVIPTERRLASLRATTAALTQKIFFFTTFDAIRKHGFWSSIWQRPTSAQPVPLIETL